MSLNKQGRLFPEEAYSSEIINFTELSVFQRCPLEYKLRFNPRDRSFDPLGPEVYLGRLFHTLASQYLSKPLSERKRNKSLSQTNIIDIRQNYRKYFHSNDNYYEMVIKTVAKLKESPLSDLEVFACEYPFKTTRENLIVKGRVDCIAKDRRGDLLLDFKLDSKELEHVNGKINRYLQLIFYYFGIKDLIPLNLPRLAHYFFSSGKIEQIESSNELLRRGWQELLRIHDECKNATTFPPKRSHFCSTCVVKRRFKCRLWEKGGLL